jgi:hypothetical protein
MKKFKQSVCQCHQKLAWEQPYPVTNQVGTNLIKDDANLPNSITEDIGAFSLAPLYSSKQLRRISQRQGRKDDRYNQEDLNPIRRISKKRPDSSLVVLKRAASSEEVML